MGLRNILFILTLIWIQADSIVEAGWQESTAIVTGSWGSGDNQFGIEYGDTEEDNWKYTSVESGRVRIA